MSALKLELLIDDIVSGAVAGTVYEADDYEGLIEAMLNGYTITNDPIGRMFSRMFFMRNIATCFQGYLAFVAGYLPEEIEHRDLMSPADIESWDDPKLPFVVIEEAQLDNPMPSGNIVTVSMLNEKTFIDSLCKVGIARLEVAPDFVEKDYPDTDYWAYMAGPKL